jgi:hypothetical protein
MLYEVCDIGSHPNLVSALNTYLSTGSGKVVIYDADRCGPGGGSGNPSPNYAGFLFPFITNNPGPRGFLSGTITKVESEILPATLTRGISTGVNGGFPPTDAVGDSNTFNPEGQGWCLSLGGTNVNGITGNQESYLRTSAGGLVIYEGNDNWFTDSATPQPNAYDKTVFDNILDQPFNPDSLPCTLPLPFVQLTPPTATNLAGGSHTVAATVTQSNGSPAVGVVVSFTLQSGPNAGKTGKAVTGAGGSATFTYSDTGGVGTDTIIASFTNSFGTLQTSNTVSKTWVIRNTTTGVSCTPASLIVNQATSCTAMVTDTSSGTAITPSGTVSFASNGAGAFTPSSCTLAGTGASASCSVGYSASPPPTLGHGTQTITGRYGGDATHAASSASFALAVNTDDPVGGELVPVNKLALMAPYIGLALTVLVVAAGVLIYFRRTKQTNKTT